MPERLREALRLACRAARLMVGIPDYDAYVAHRLSVHPDEPVMSHAEFLHDRQQCRYGGRGPGGCC